jgi:hypothetical protein
MKVELKTKMKTKIKSKKKNKKNNKTQMNAGLQKTTQSSIAPAVKCISRHITNYRNTTKEYAGLILQTNI